MENQPNKIKRTETSQVDPVFVERVVDKIQIEIGEQLSMNPDMSMHEVKIAALNRLMDLIHRGLLTNDEGDAIYQRFARMVNHYMGF